MGFPVQHRTKPRSVDPLERADEGVKRRTGVAGISPPEASAVRPVGAVLFETDDGWATRNRHVRLGPTAGFASTVEGEAAPPGHAPVPSKAA